MLARLRPSKPDDWRIQIVALYRGVATPDSVVAAAARQPQQEARAKALCDAHYHVGQHHLMRGATADAVASFRAALPDCHNPFARAEVRAELHKLKS